MIKIHTTQEKERGFIPIKRDFGASRFIRIKRAEKRPEMEFTGATSIKAAPSPGIVERVLSMLREGPIGRSIEQALPGLKVHPGATKENESRNILNLGELVQKGDTFLPPTFPKSAQEKATAALKGVATGVSGLTEPGNLLLMLGTGAASNLVKEGAGLAAEKVLSKMVSLGFSAQMLKSLYDGGKVFKEKIKSGDVNGAIEAAGEMLPTGVMASLGLIHGTTGWRKASVKPAISETPESLRAKMPPETRAIVDSIEERLKQKSEARRLVEESEAKQKAEVQEKPFVKEEEIIRIHRPMKTENGAARLNDLTPAFGKDIYSKNAVQNFGTGDDLLDRKTIQILRSVRNKPDAEISVYRAVPKEDPANRLSPGDWVTVNKQYAERHGDSILSGDYKIIEQKVKVGDLTTNPDSFHEQGYYPRQSFMGEKGGVKIDPVVGEFVKQDIFPVAMSAREALDRLVKLVNPTAGVSESTLQAFYGMKGNIDKAQFQIQALGEDMLHRFNKNSREENIAFIDAIKEGKKQPTQGLQDFADFYRKIDNQDFEAMQKYKPSLPFLENHFRVTWKIIPGSLEEANVPMGKRPLRGDMGMLKKHTLDNISDGIARGGIPYSYNPQILFERAHLSAVKFVEANKLWTDLKKMKLRKYVRASQRTPDGFSEIPDSIAKVWFNVDYPGGGKASAIVGRWVVEENAARLLNNWLSRDLIRESPIGSGLLWAKNATTQIELSLSLFHATFESLESVGSQIGLGLRKAYNVGLLQKNPRAAIEGLKEIVTSIAAPKTNYRLGRAAIKAYGKPEEFLATPEGQWLKKKFPDILKTLDEGFAAGMKLTMHDDYRNNTIQTFKDNIASKNYIGAVLRAAPALNDLMMQPLFQTYIPRLKVGMFVREYTSELMERAPQLATGEISRFQIAKKSWQFVEDKLGEMNFDNMFWDRTFKSALQLAFRSVTWKLGNLRSFGQVIPGQLREIKSAYEYGRFPLLDRNMAWLIGMSGLTVAISEVISRLATGKGPQTVKDLVFPQIDKNDPSVRLSIPVYWKDPVSFFHSPTDYVGRSMSGEIGRIADIWSNRDFYGTKVFNEDDPWINRQVDKFVHLAPVPFSFSSLRSMREKGESAPKQIGGFLGFTKAPYYISQTPAQMKMSEYAAENQPTGGRTRRQKDRNRALSRITSLLRSHKDASGDIRKAIGNKLITQKDIRQAVKRSREDTLMLQFSRLRLDQSMKVFSLMNNEEKKKAYPVLIRKVVNARKNSPLEYEMAIPQLRVEMKKFRAPVTVQ